MSILLKLVTIRKSAEGSLTRVKGGRSPEDQLIVVCVYINECLFHFLFCLSICVYACMHCVLPIFIVDLLYFCQFLTKKGE